MPKNTTIRFSDEEYKWLKNEAESQQRTVSNLIKRVLNLYKKNQNGVAGGVPSGTTTGIFG